MGGVSSQNKNLTLEQKIAYWRRSDRPALIESIKNSDAGLNFVAELAFASDQLKFEDGIFRIDEVFAFRLTVDALHDRDSWDLALDIIQANLRASAYIPSSLGIIGAGSLCGVLTAPSRPGPKRSKNRRRDEAIVRAIEGAVCVGIPASLNPATISKRGKAAGKHSSSFEPICAVDLVVEAFNEVNGYAISFETVENVWKKRKPSGRLNELQRIQRALYVSIIRKMGRRHKSSDKPIEG